MNKCTSKEEKRQATEGNGNGIVKHEKLLRGSNKQDNAFSSTTQLL